MLNLGRMKKLIVCRVIKAMRGYDFTEIESKVEPLRDKEITAVNIQVIARNVREIAINNRNISTLRENVDKMSSS